MTTTGTVLIIDDHELVAASIAYLLCSRGLDAYRAPVADLATARQAASEHAPGVALLDLELGTTPDGTNLDGVELVGPLRAQGWTVLVVTGTAELDRIAAAVAAGAANWVVKGANLAELVAATVALAEGHGGLTRAERREMLERHRDTRRTRGHGAERLARLTAKEREVLDRLTAGASPREIARQTHTSEHTVRAHIRGILRKLEVGSQGAATAVARQHTPPPQSLPARRWRRMRAGGGQCSAPGSGSDISGSAV